MNNSNNISEIQLYLQRHMKEIRAKARNRCELNFEDNKCIRTEIRDWTDNGLKRKRVVVFLRGTGCTRVENNGGCTFCGFYNATKKGTKVKNEDYLSQMREIISVWDKDISKICFYNDGSILADEEIDFNTVLEIFKILEVNTSITSVTIESKIEDITKNKLEKIRSVYSKDLEIAVGYESSNALIRDICINKSFEDRKFESAVEDTKRLGIHLIPLLMFKPPFLSEKEASKDMIESLIYLEKFNLRRIDIELPTIEIDTLSFELWERGQYKPLNLWTLVHVLKMKERLELKTRIYVSPMDYSVESYDRANSCDKCRNIFARAIKEYNISQEVNLFNDIRCECKNRWKIKFEKENEKSIQERVITFLDGVSKKERKMKIELD